MTTVGLGGVRSGFGGGVGGVSLLILIIRNLILITS